MTIVLNQVFEFFFLTMNKSIVLVAFIISVVSSFFIAKLTIMIHRSILLREFDIKAMFSWSFKELKFIMMGIVIGFLSFFLVGIIMSIIGAMFGLLSSSSILVMLPMLLTAVFGGLIACRLTLVLPSIAVEQDITLAMAWEESRIHIIKLFILIIGVPIVFMTLTFALMSMAVESELLLFLVSSLRTTVWVYEVAIITHCYEALFGKQQDEQKDQVQVL